MKTNIKTYTDPSGRYCLENNRLEEVIGGKIADGCILPGSPGYRQDAFDFTINFEGESLRAKGVYTWGEEGFDALEITSN